MLGDRKEIHSGDNSTNIQGQSVTVYSGISYQDAREIALQTFKDNFYDLSEVAKKTALERAEVLVNRFLEKLKIESPELIGKITEPDLQYAVINAQKQFARSGQNGSLEILSDLLKSRFQIDESSLKRIVLNEAIEASSKLTDEQIMLISVLFLVKSCSFPGSHDFIRIISKLINGNSNAFLYNYNYYEHLLYAGIVSNDVTVDSSQKLEYFIKMKFPNETEDIINKYNDSVSQSVFDNWNNSYLMRFRLTSVGTAIALAYYNTFMGTNIKLDSWIDN